METWGMDYNGGPYHRGVCPSCEKYNGECTDGLCDKCEELELSEIDLTPLFDEIIEEIKNEKK